MKSNESLISIVVPAFNEEDCIEELARRLIRVMNNLSRYDFEILIVDNGSTDRTWLLLQRLAEVDKRFKPFRLSRNFGTDGGITAGLDVATGDACVIMTADLQDPPELIEKFVEKWESGYENIFMVVESRASSSFIRRISSKLFYFIADRLTSGMIPRGVSDFRLVDRKVYEAVRAMKEQNRFIRGLFAWAGFRSIGIKQKRPERFGGESKANYSSVLRLAKYGVFSFSDVPLRLITWCGLTFSSVAIVGMLTFAVLRLTMGTPFAGFATLITVILFFFGVLSFMLGILAEYTAIISREVKRRPNYIIAEKNF